MRDIPIISTLNPEIQVEEIRYRRGPFGRGYWLITWCPTGEQDSGRCSRSRLRLGERGGEAELDGVRFRFDVRWRPERRRAQAPQSERSRNQHADYGYLT